ncbi:hypothetical protein HYH85_18680 [Clostridium botulinum]|nr:hypothetical protein [Clostridium botulinum]MBY6867988.1 hypothetical protein [Clostridium botulinum]
MVYSLNKGFDKLSIDNQVEFINGELKKDKEISVTKLCKKHGINKSTIISRFTTKGYKYNAELRCYIKDILIQNNNKNIKSKEIQVSKKDNLIELQDIKELKELLEMKEQLKEIIQEYNKNKNIIDVPEDPELKVDLNKFKGELKGRLIKVYDNINKDWIKFCKKNNQFKMQDLYSLALLEFMNKYKK